MGSVAALGVGFDKTVMDMVDGGAWLANDGRGATHVNGDSGEADAAIKFLGLDGHELQVIEGPDGTYVLDLTTGQLYRIDTANLGEATASSNVGSGVDVVVGGGKAYVVDMKAGKVTPMDPLTLTPIGAEVVVGAPVTRGVIDSDGLLWVGVPSRGESVAISGDRVERTVEVGADGDDIEPAIVGGEAVVVNRSRAQVVRVARGGGAVDLPVRAGAPLRVPRDGPDATLRVVDPEDGVLAETDLADGRSTTTDLGRKGSDLGEPEANGGRTYVPDRSKGDVIVCRDGHVDDGFAVTESGGSGRIETKRSGPNTYFNDPASRRSVAVDSRGNRHEIDKYRADIATNERPADTPNHNPPPPPPNPKPKPKQPLGPTGTKPPEPPKPGAPDAPAVTSATPGDAKATVAWSAGDDGGSPITTFRVRAQPGGKEVTVGANQRQATVEGLQNDTTYTLTVWATNDKGDSPPAQSAPVTPHTGIPDAPGSVKADQPQEPAYVGKVHVEWAEPDLHGGTITGYEVVPIVGGKTDRAKIVAAPAGDTETDVDGLAPGSKVSVTVAAKYNAPNGGGTLVGTPSSPTKPLTVGGPPEIKNQKATAFGDRQIKVDWDVTDFGAKLTSCGVIQLDNRTDHPGCGHYEAGGYAYSQQYWFKIYAQNAFGKTEADVLSSATNPKPTWVGRIDYTYGGPGCVNVWDTANCFGGFSWFAGYQGDGKRAPGSPVIHHNDTFTFECWTDGGKVTDWGTPSHSSTLWYKVDGQGWYYSDLWMGRTGSDHGLPHC